jgi:hypothetical protein
MNQRARHLRQSNQAKPVSAIATPWNAPHKPINRWQEIGPAVSRAEHVLGKAILRKMNAHAITILIFLATWIAVEERRFSAA